MFEQEYRLDKDENVIPVKNYKKAVYNAFCRERNRIQNYIAGNINYYKDFTDNHKYNGLRTKLIEQRKRQEAREATDGI